MKRLLFLLITLSLLTAGCTKKQPVLLSFYTWKGEMEKEDLDSCYLKESNAQKLYARMFDIDDTGNGAHPVSKVQYPQNVSINLPIIPVVFITNRTLAQCAEKDIDSLARKCMSQIDAQYNRIFKKSPPEYQFDCDWTEKTRNRYFRFINDVKQLRKDVPLSCTIRLHQIKYRKQTGVPPVDKGVLMYYASSEPTEFSEKNSILDTKEAARYIEKLNTYPLHLDIALPLYSWGIVRSPFGQFKLINGVRESELATHPEMYRKKGKGLYETLQSHYMRGVWISQGYEVKVEEVEVETLLEAATMLKQKLKPEQRELIFYHLDSELMKRYKTTDLIQIQKALS